MRKSVDQIGAVPGGSGEGGFLKQAGETLKTLKEVMELGRAIRGQEQAGNQAEAIGTAAAPAGRWGAFLGHLVKAGYGDKPLGQILTELAPYTINQLIELGKEAAKNGAGSKE